MCTIAVAFRMYARWPVVVAANRDAPQERASETWAVREPDSAPPIVAPMDLVGGGTWIGLSAVGLFAAVSSFYLPGTTGDPARRSRGDLVPGVLRHRSASAARAASLAIGDPRPYNPFNLIVADVQSAWLWSYDGAESRVIQLEPGLHVVTNRAPDFHVPRVDIARERWPAEPDLARLCAVLTVHGPGRQATCFHTMKPHGTRSAAVLRIASVLGDSDLHVADGRPCETRFEDRSALLRTLATHATAV
jgi:uncharacterized protein with NRDE domain